MLRSNGMKQYRTAYAVCGLAVAALLLPILGRAAANAGINLEELSKPPIMELTGLVLKEVVFNMAGPPQPIVLRSEQDVAKYFSEMSLVQLRKQLNFKQQILLLFVWQGSGQDKLTYTVAESIPEQIVFIYKPGSTLDQRQHVRVYVLRSDVQWSTTNAIRIIAPIF
jgi:hypothetical protein